jgi:hypothetical protein
MMMKVMDIDELIEIDLQEVRQQGAAQMLDMHRNRCRNPSKRVARNQAMHVSDLIANMMAAQVYGNIHSRAYGLHVLRFWM